MNESPHRRRGRRESDTLHSVSMLRGRLTGVTETRVGVLASFEGGDTADADVLVAADSDRIVIIGDAAHPVGAGQGASMAIEDALALAAALQAEASIGTALRRYDADRRPRIAKVLGTAEDNRNVKRAGPVKRRMQAAMMRVFVPMFYEKATAWLYAYEPAELAK